MPLIQEYLAQGSERPGRQQIRLQVERALFLKRRWRGLAEDGTEFEFDLKSRLLHGCVIHQTDAADYVISQREETVYEIPVTTASFAALVGWKIGNLHFPVEILDGCVRVTNDPSIQQLIQREGWTYEEKTVVFMPLRAMPHAS